ncbi:MAG TPA: hypothetical protein VFU15_16140, partial [Bacteroidia bacterium]|nr:hypothetical protein [Bacteroidia bacterium]
MAKAKAASKNIPVQTSFWQNDRNTGFALAAFAFLLYAQTISYGFVLDDVAVVHGNEFVKSGFSGFGKILTTFYWHGFPNFATANSGLFRPVSLLLFATEWQLFPGKPHVFHFVQVALYAICAYQLYRLLRELLRDHSGSLALMTTLLWIVLPVHTEVVANIKSADEVLSLLFFLLSFRKILAWSETGKTATLVSSAGLIFLSLLSKEGAVMFVPVMLIALMQFRNKTAKQLVLPAGVFLATGIVWLVWHSWVISHAGSAMITYDYRNNALLSSTSVADRTGTAIGMQARYWMKMLAGFPLSYNYSFNEIPVDGFAGVWTWIALAGIFAAGFFAYKNFRKNPVVSFSLLFYFITFALTCNIFYLIGETFAERLAFVPSIGFCLLFSFLVLRFTNGLREKRIHAQAMYVLVPLALVYSIRTFSRSQVWTDEPTLYTNDVDNAPNSARVHDNSGVLLYNAALGTQDPNQKKQLFGQAYSEFSTAYTIDSVDFQAAHILAEIEFNRGNNEEAIRWGRKNIACFRFFHVPPNDPTVYSLIGNAFMNLQQYDSAHAVFATAASQYPGNESFTIALGGNSLAQKDTTGAISFFEKATSINPKSVAAWDKLANVRGMHRDYR